MGFDYEQGREEVDTVGRVAVSEGLSAGAGSVLSVLRWLPLASADDLAAIMGRPWSGVLNHLGLLKGRSLVASTQLGCTRKQRQRWNLTEFCLDRSELEGATWHDEAARCRLLELIPAVEQFYPIVGLVKDLGSFRAFQWLDATGDEGPSCDAAALYENGWVSFFWCGRLLSEHRLAERLVRFPLDCQTLALGSAVPWPSQIHLVTADEWERELASRVVEDLGMERMAGIWCVSNGAASLPAEVGNGRGWIHQPVKRRQSAPGSWDTSTARSPWSGAGGLVAARVLDGAEQWPGARLRFLRALLREGSEEGRVGEMCKQLRAGGLMRRSGERQTVRYFPTDSGLHVRATQDRIHHLEARSRTHLSLWPEANRTRPKHPVSADHEDGLRALLQVFAAAGCALANGTRFVEHLGIEGGIAPDAILYLTVSPYGEGWHHVEYERSARGRARVSKKIRGYGSARRRDEYPLILVCWDERAEAEFQAEGRLLGLRLVTTTIKRLKNHGPLHPTDCWSMYGQPVRLG